MLNRIFPSTFRGIQKLGKRKNTGFWSLGCLIGFFGSIPVLVSSLENLGISLLVTFIVAIFFFMVVGTYLVQANLLGKVINDYLDWPIYIHHLIILFFFLAVLGIIIKIYKYYELRKQNS